MNATVSDDPRVPRWLMVSGVILAAYGVYYWITVAALWFR